MTRISLPLLVVTATCTATAPGGGAGGGSGLDGSRDGELDRAPGSGGQGIGGGGAGVSPGTGGAPVADPLLGAAPRCTSGVMWAVADRNTPVMRPGESCSATGACHGAGASFQFDLSGTVYPTGHEPDDCNGYYDPRLGASAVGIEITDATGGVLQMGANSAGNFYYLGAIAFPIHAKLVLGGKERVMLSAASTGDCNSCHTQTGNSAAPGRLTIPF